MTSLRHLSPVDRAGARRIVRAWTMDGTPTQYDTAYQNSHRDPLGHARYFEYLKTLTKAQLRKSNRSAVKALKARDAIMEERVIDCQPTTPVSL